MTFLFTARGTFGPNHHGDEKSWKSYIEWSRLTQLTELVSLDVMLNEDLVDPDYNKKEDWKYAHVAGEYLTGLFTSIDYVIKKMEKRDKYNLLTVIIEPEKDCRNIEVDEYQFVGYDLVDPDFAISALTNCGGFNETILPQDLNDKGLIDDFQEAYNIKNLLKTNYPEDHHAHTNVIAIWRHKTLGR